MQAVTTIGLDIAKSVFQIHGVDAAGNVIVRRSSSAALLKRHTNAAPSIGPWLRSVCDRITSRFLVHSSGFPVGESAPPKCHPKYVTYSIRMLWPSR
jgi:hypothetical protein